MKEELSASALQIKEKAERMIEMLLLAEEITEQQIREIVANKPQASEEEIIKQLKSEGILTMAFIHEYIIRISVSLNIAKGYFEHHTKRLNPSFIEFNPNREARKQGKKPTHFHIREGKMRAILGKGKNEEKT